MALQYYENLQMNNIPIPNHCILEIYKDGIGSDNGLGYYIMPLEERDSNADIEDKIRTEISNTAPAGYTNLAILSGNSYTTYKSRIVYCIWYQGNVAPLYPDEPVVNPLPNPATMANVWETININNNGAKITPANIELTIEANGDNIEFIINEDIYQIMPLTQLAHYILSINDNGVFVDGTPISEYNISHMPILKPGINLVRVKTTNVSNIDIEFTPEY